MANYRKSTTQITEDNKQYTYETNKTNNIILKSLITHYNN